MKSMLANTLPTIFLLSLALGVLSCQKDNEENAITEDEAAAILEGAVTLSTDGLAAELLDGVLVSTKYAEKSGLGGPCGEAFDSTVTRSLSIPRFSFNFVAAWAWKVLCDNQGVPNALEFNRTAEGSYQMPRVSSADKVNGQWRINNISGGAPYQISGTHRREGATTIQLREQRSITTNLEIKVDNLEVAKNTRQILSGEADFTLRGETGFGGRFRYVGNITFLGGGKARLTINGNTFDIDLG
jgi:hypothetical protein